MYVLQLTTEDVDTIAHVGDRYSWSSALSFYPVGTHYLEEVEAWELVDSFEEDREGGHSLFPCLDCESELAEKLCVLLESMV